MKNLPISASEKYIIISELSTMLAAGIPIMEAVESLLNDSKGNSKKLLEAVREDLLQGKKMSESFSSMPKSFDPVTTSLVSAGEESGTLEVTLKDIAGGVKKDMELAEKVKSALVYPSLVMVVFAVVFVIILTFVIPRVASVFSRLRVTLPLPTRILIYISNIFTHYTIPIIAGTLLLVFFVVLIYKIKKQVIIGFVTKWPLVNKLALELDLTRFSHTLYLLLGAGIPITKALELARSVVSQKKVYKAVDSCIQTAVSGKKLSEGFREHKNIFPGMMIRVTEVGEKSGTLEKSMQNLSEYFDGKVTNSLKNLTVLLEPVLILVVGVLVGGMMLSIIAPIYQLIGQLGGR